MSAAAVVIPCEDLDRAIEACRSAGFRLDAIGPADEPTWAELSRPGLVIVVEASTEAGTDRAADDRPGPRLRLPLEPGDWPDDHGLGIEIDAQPHPRSPSGTGPVVPTTTPSLTISHEADGSWKHGRAGMRYRDLIPDRWGGAYIASHIHVPDGGPVPDYVHHHDIVHQLIFCHRGWVEVVYQDQGPPFVLQPGDCVLQPPGIRHRVLATSDDLYVVEVGCPAVHRTSVDHDLDLPNQAVEPARRYGGQRFARHVADQAPWEPAPEAASSGGAVEQQDTGLGRASGGLVDARRLRVGPTGVDLTHDDDLRLVFVTDGSATLTRPDGSTTGLAEGSSAALPPGDAFHLTGAEGTVVLDVRSPGRAPQA